MMTLRFFEDAETGQPHIHRHLVSESEVEAVLARPLEDRAGSEGSRIALGQTAGATFEWSMFPIRCRTRPL